MRPLLILLMFLVSRFPSSALGASAEEFIPAHLEAMDAAVNAAVANHEIPGAVLWIERGDEQYQKAYGSRQTTPKVEKMTLDTIFDLASLTKVVATTPSILKLIDEGKLQLEEPVSSYLPEFNKPGHERVLLRNLLTHTSGLPPGIPRVPSLKTYADGIKLACTLDLREQPGTKFVYSDVNFILLGEIVKRISGKGLNVFAKQNFFDPLQMEDTGFLPKSRLRSRIAPTELELGGLVRGLVHDPTSRLMGGVTGHAGCFGTAADLAKYARFWLRKGMTSEGERLLKAKLIDAATSRQSPDSLEEQRGLGWDLQTGYSSPRGEVFPVEGTYGHSGWTGTSLWIDPASKAFVILLTNRNHPTEQGTVHNLRIEVATQAALAMRLQRPAPAVQVLNGIDVLKQAQFAPLKNLRMGLITNHTGLSREGETTIDLLAKAPGVQLKALFSPEHGIRGQLDQEQIKDGKDEATGLPIFSLYQGTRKPTAEQLRELDILVFDIQDIGCRFYTYIGTMLNAMEAASEAGLRFMVLDRINPLSGIAVEGPICEGEPKFTSIHPLPLRHGMTVGELAKLFATEKRLKLPLEIVKMEGWNRSMWQDQTGLKWTNPSPNMRSLEAANLYPGVALIEFTNVSVGRGTDTPFHIIGAPWMNSAKVIARLREEKLPGVSFVPVKFTPNSSTHAGKLCQGVRFIVFDRNFFSPVMLGAALIRALHLEHSDAFKLEPVKQLLRHPTSLGAFKSDEPLSKITKCWEPELGVFQKRRQEVLLYK